jgi:fibronectin-binding autotransporter adhesin
LFKLKLKMKKFSVAALAFNASFSALRKALFVLPALAVTMAGSARAQVTSTWTAAGGSWLTPADWSNNTIPGATSGTTSQDTAIFGSSGAGTVTTDGYRNIDNITFNGSSAYTLSGGSGGNFYLTKGGEIQNTSTSTASETISTPITLEGAYTFDSSAASSSNILTVSSNITQAATGTLTVQGSNTGVNLLSGSISNGAGVLSINKTGAGTWTISNGSNTYTGGTTVSSGILIGGATGSLGSGTVTLAGGSFSDNGNTLTNAFFAQAGTNTNLFTNANGSSGNWQYSGTLTGSGGVTITQGGVDSLLWYGNDTGFTGTFTDSQYVNGTVFRVYTDNFGSANAYFVFNNTNSGSNGDITFYEPAGTMYFGSFTGSGNLGGASNATTIVAGNLNQNDTFSGASGSGFSYTKVGTGTQTFTGVENFNTLTVSSGAVQIGTGGIGSESGTIVVGSGTTIGFNSTATTSASIANSGTIIGNESSGVLTLLNGVISGTGTFVQTGTGTTSITNANTYTGGTTISAGSVILAGNNAAAGTGTITLAGGALIDGITLSNGILAQAGTSSLVEAAPGGNGSLYSNISGSGNITVANEYNTSSANSFYLGGPTTNNSGFTGTFTIPAITPGTFVRFNGLGFGSANASFVINDTVAGDITWQTPSGSIYFGSLTGNGNLGGESGVTIVAGNLNQNDLFSGTMGSFIFNKVGTGTQTFTGSNPLGSVIISSGVLQLGSGGTTGDVNNSPILNNATLVLNRSGSASFGDAISGTGTVTMLGTGTTTLSGANTYSGATLVQSGTLQAGTTNAFGTNAAVYMSNVAGATLDLNGTTDQVGTLTGGGSLGGNVTLNNGKLTVGGDNASLAAYAGAISGSNSNTALDTVTKIGTGTQIFSGANTYTGVTTISGGTLQLGAGGTTGLATGAITDNANLAFNFSHATVGNAITGSGSVTQMGTGTTTLTGNANTYSGNTFINAGTLYAANSSGSSSATGTGTVTINNGGNLNGSGYVSGPVVVGGGGSINMIDGNITTLNLSSASGSVPALTLGTGTTASILGFDVSGAGNVGSSDMINLSNENGAGLYVGSAGFTVNINATSALQNGQYYYLVYNGPGLLTSGSVASPSFAFGTTTGDFYGNSGVLSMDNFYSLVLTMTANANATNAYYNGAASQVTSQGGNTAWDSFVNGNANTSNFGTGAGGTGNANGLLNGSSNLFFDSGVTGPLVTSPGAITAINSLNFSTHNSVTVNGTGSNTLTINATNANGNTAGNGITLASGAGNDIINAPIVLGSSQTWTVTDTTNILTMNGAVSGSGKSLTKAGAGIVVLNAANTYSGGTTVSAGTLYANGGVAGSSSGTGTGAVHVSSGASFGGSGVVRPTINGAGVVLAGGSSLISGGIQAANSPTTAAGSGMTLDNTGSGAPGVILNAAPTLGTANLTFYLGYGATTNAANNAGPSSFTTPDTNSSYLKVVGNTAGELTFKTGDTITVNDLTNGNLTPLVLYTPYLLIQAGSNADFSGLLTSGMTSLSDPEANGFVENLTLQGTSATFYPGLKLYLDNGELEIVPEPGTWALMIGGLGLLVVLQRRKSKRA